MLKEEKEVVVVEAKRMHLQDGKLMLKKKEGVVAEKL